MIGVIYDMRNKSFNFFWTLLEFMIILLIELERKLGGGGQHEVDLFALTLKIRLCVTCLLLILYFKFFQNRNKRGVIGLSR